MDNNVSIEKVFVVIKPDALARNLSETIYKYLRSLDLSIIERKVVVFSLENIFELWPNIYGQSWTERTIEYLKGQKVEVAIVCGNNAIAKLLNLKKKLREDYLSDDPVKSMIHSSDSMEEFNREYKIFFKK